MDTISGSRLPNLKEFDQDFRDGAVRIVRETGKPVAQVARALGAKEGTLGNWVMLDRKRRESGDGAGCGRAGEVGAAAP